jgi:hypothetical protein
LAGHLVRFVARLVNAEVQVSNNHNVTSGPFLYALLKQFAGPVPALTGMVGVAAVLSMWGMSTGCGSITLSPVSLVILS